MSRCRRRWITTVYCVSGEHLLHLDKLEQLIKSRSSAVMGSPHDQPSRSSPTVVDLGGDNRGLQSLPPSCKINHSDEPPSMLVFMILFRPSMVPSLCNILFISFDVLTIRDLVQYRICIMEHGILCSQA